MFARCLATLAFIVLMTLSIVGSTLIVLFLYVPAVAIKAVVLTVLGKTKPATPPSASTPKPRVPSA